MGSLGLSRRRGILALVAAATVGAALAAFAWADIIAPDGDVVTPTTDETTVNLGVVAPGATLTPKTSFRLVCAGKNHVDENQTITLSYNAGASTIPSGGSLSATTASIGPIPAAWPDDTTGGGSTNCPTTPPALADNGDSTVTITAPLAPGTYTFTPKWSLTFSPGQTDDPSDVTGAAPSVTYTVTVETPPAVTTTVPANAATNVARNANIDLTFNESVAVSGSWFTISCANSGSHAAAVSGSGSSRTLNPTVDFAFGETCTVTVLAAGVTDTDTADPPDTMVANHVFSFTTVPPPNTPPSISVTGVSNGSTYNEGSVPAPGCSATDAEDGASSPAPAVGSVVGPYASDGIGTQTVTCSVTDAGGLSATASATYSIVDPTAPSISYVLAPAAPDGANGWYTSDVSLTWSVTDAESPISIAKTGCVDQSITTDQAATNYSCSATSAGGSAGPVNVSVKRDATKPSLTATHTADGSTGWNVTAPVSVAVTASDAGSGLNGPPACTVDGSAVATSGSDPNYSLSVSGEGTHTVSCTATDNAGNAQTATDTVKIDTIAPTATASRTPTANANGWNNTDVTVHFEGTDGGSGVVACDADVVLSAEGAGQSASGTCTDEAGNVSDAASITDVNIDKTAPGITFTGQTPDKNANGWNNTDVTLNWTCTDALSLTLAPSVDALVTSEGENQQGTGTCTDNAGNTSSDTNGDVDLDKTKPAASASAAPSANANGWNNTDVTVTFSGTDALSGIDGCDPAAVLSAEAAVQSASGTCTDKAGNTSDPAGVNGINIDKTAPATSAVATPAANPNGWHNTDVTVTFSGTDALSGVDTCDPAVVLSVEGAGQSASGTCTDKAGNTSGQAEATGINIDKTAPTLTWSGGPADGASYYFGFVPGAPTCTAADALSGPGACNVTGYATTVGTHTMKATAVDRAGNQYVEQRTYTVLAWTLRGFYQPVDMSGSSIVYNTVKGGSTVPLKFELFAGSTELTDTAMIKTLTYAQTTCDATSMTDEIETVATGGTSLRYDSTGGQFIYNWKTPATPGRCYRVTMATQDGSSLVAYFKLK